jgi:hypothetical protein
MCPRGVLAVFEVSEWEELSTFLESQGPETGNMSSRGHREDGVLRRTFGGRAGNDP